MRDGGVSFTMLGEYFGVTTSAVRCRYHRATANRHRVCRPWQASDIEALLFERAAGRTFRQIAKTLGRSEASCGIKYREIKTRDQR